MTTMPQLGQNALYQALIGRRSVRRYESTPLSEETLDRVRANVSSADPLVAANHFNVLIRDVMTADDLVEALGGYGRLLSPPHFMVPTMMGNAHVLTDLAYRTQQVVIQMTSMGIGSCYIGSLGREPTLRVRFLLKRAARVGAIVIFGPPATALGGRTMNAAMRTVMGSSKRLPVEKVFFEKSFEKPGLPPEEIAPLIEAARHAPSALNVQPWRFLWRKKQLTLFVQKENSKYGKTANQDYRFFDAGLCMANLMLGMRALGIAGKWELLEKDARDVPAYPPELEPVARLQFER